MHIDIPLPPPPTHQAALRIMRTKDGRQFIGKSARSSAKKWSNAATLLIKSEMNRQAEEMKTGFIAVKIDFYYKHTQESERYARKMGADIVIKNTRPDLDNLAKSVLDCLVDAGVIKDDGQIYYLALRKYYASEAKVIVDISSDSEDN
jgi:Holliday junction resolvase RusA-like endonuclease